MNSRDIVIQRITKKISVTKTTRKYGVPGLLLAGLALGFAAFRQYQQTGDAGPNFIAVGAVVLIMMGVAILINSFKGRNDARLLEYASTHPEKIVWIYQHVLKVNGNPQESMMVCDDEGTVFQLPVKRKKGQPDELMDALVNTFPHAVIGFSHDRKIKYKSDPRRFSQIA